ncbi:hypothetical protein, partial [Staphylococcus aureus]
IVNATAKPASTPVSYTHLRAHETLSDLVCRLLLEKRLSALKKRSMRLLLSTEILQALHYKKHKRLLMSSM